MSIYDQDLDKNPANYAPLSPVSFIERTAEVYGDLPSIVHGARRYLWRETRERSARLAAALRALGVAPGSTVSVMLTNTPEMVEAHYAIPALNAVLNTLNTRLDARLLAWQMQHCEASVLISDREFGPVMQQALRILRESQGRTPLLIEVCDSEYGGAGASIGGEDYEAPSAETMKRLKSLIAEGRPLTLAYYPAAEHGMTLFEVAADGSRVSTRYAPGYFAMIRDFARDGQLGDAYGDAQMTLPRAVR